MFQGCYGKEDKKQWPLKNKNTMKIIGILSVMHYLANLSDSVCFIVHFMNLG